MAELNNRPLKIGILNVMHDKLDTQKRFSYVLRHTGVPVDITYFYPRMHYQNRPVPDLVAQISEPLGLAKAEQMDAFIITGAPLEHLDFFQVTYIDEVRELMACLQHKKVEQLYVCWGAMAALDYFYDIQKQMLPEKIFGIYPQEILADNSLLAGLKPGFLAPHARYAEMNKKQIEQHPDLTLNSVSETGHMFLATADDAPQAFLFSHLEYGPQALLKEYKREAAAKPDQAASLAKPQNYFANPQEMKDPIFSWENTQKKFYRNWIKQVAANRKKLKGEMIYE